MSFIVTDVNGSPAPNANWGNTDLSGIDMRNYPNIDTTETATRAGYVGPRYVRIDGDKIGDVSTGRMVAVAKQPSAGYCPLAAARDEEVALVKERITADSYLR